MLTFVNNKYQIHFSGSEVMMQLGPNKSGGLHEKSWNHLEQKKTQIKLISTGKTPVLNSVPKVKKQKRVKQNKVQ